MAFPLIPILGTLIQVGIQQAAKKDEVPVQPYQAPQVAKEVIQEALQTPQFESLAEKFTPQPWWKSITIWGLIISLVFKLGAVFLPWLEQPGLAEGVTQMVVLGVSLVGDALAARGRWKAERPLTVQANPAPKIT